MWLGLSADHESSSRCGDELVHALLLRLSLCMAIYQSTAFYRICKIKILIVLWNLCKIGIIVVGDKKEEKLNIYAKLSFKPFKFVSSVFHTCVYLFSVR